MNKIIISIGLILLSLIGYSQKYTALDRTTVSGNLRPPIDTIVAPMWLGEVRTRLQDSALYVAVSLTAGTQRWKKDVPSGSGISDLDLTRNATSATLVPDVGSSVPIPSADETDAGVLPAYDKKKVNRLEPVKNFTEMRAISAPQLDTGIIYMVKDRFNLREYYYDPSDISSADDSATVIVTSGGARFKRLFRGMIRPEDFGAYGFDALDDSWPLRKMIAYANTVGFVSANGGVAIHLTPGANYRLAEGQVLDIAFIGNDKIFEIKGNGAKITGNTIFRRRPPVGVGANEQGLSIIIKNITFLRTGTQTGSIAVDIGSTYSSMVENCHFQAFDTALVFRFGLNSISRGNMFTNNLNGIAFTYGSIWGGSTSNSQSNGSVSENDRIFNSASTKNSISFEAASDCEVRNIIIEGSAPDYGIHFDDRAATVVEDFKVHGMHFETVPTPDRAAIYFRGSGYFELTDVYVQQADTFLVINQSATLTVNVKRFAFWPSGIKIATVNGGTPVYFEDIPYGNTGDFVANTFVNGNGYTLPTSVSMQAKGSATFRGNNTFGWQHIDINNPKSVFAVWSVDAVRFTDMHLQFTNDSSDNIGTQSSLRPRHIYTAGAFIANANADGLRFITPSGIGIVNRFDHGQVLRVVVGAGYNAAPAVGAFGIPRGTTAQRPTGDHGYLRANSDSAATTRSAEIYIQGAWRTIGLRQDIIDQNTLLTTQIQVAGFTDNFSLTTTGSRTVALGETIDEIHLKPTQNITIDIGTTASGNEIQGGLFLAANQTVIIPYKRTADAAFDIHFTGITAGTLAIKLFKRKLP